MFLFIGALYSLIIASFLFLPMFAQEMGVIRFHPSLPKGFDPYNTLYSYLNNKQRYGIVDSNQMEIFMVPLAAYQPVPSKLHAFGGPGRNWEQIFLLFLEVHGSGIEQLS